MTKSKPGGAGRRPGISVVRLLLVAAGAGVLGGVVLSLRQQPTQEETMEQAEAAADQMMPMGSPVRPRFDMMAPDPMSLRGIPPYPGAGGVPRKITSSRPGSQEVSAISWFTTPDSVDRVLTFYEQAYSDANIIHVSHRFSDKRGYVSWFEKRANPDGGRPDFGDGVLHMVFASREGDSTTVLLSANEPYLMLQRVNPLPGGVKLPEGARPQVMNLGEGGLDHFSIFAEYQGKSPEALLTEVVDGMRQGGWVVGEPTRAPGGRSTVVASLNSHVQIAVVEGTLAGAQVLVTLEQRNARQRGTTP